MYHQVAFRNSVRQLHPQPVRLLKWVLIRRLGEGGLPGGHLQPGNVPQQHLRRQHRYGIHNSTFGIRFFKENIECIRKFPACFVKMSGLGLIAKPLKSLFVICISNTRTVIK